MPNYKKKYKQLLASCEGDRRALVQRTSDLIIELELNKSLVAENNRLNELLKQTSVLN